ncbi:MAG: hypothetical protein APF76_00415 [Desulfitibacter sp. BRH_c19]|nr:MAG: hypothetical protein APF76_00415 [Desulfitibacter sp. BRH_c19]
MKTNKQEKLYLRFNKTQILIHWVFAGSFFVLAGSGLILIVPGLSALAASGVSAIAHRVAASLFMLSVVAYYIKERNGLKRLVKESFSYDKDDIIWITKMFQYFLGKTKTMPPSGRLNGGEKLHHALIVITFFTISISGLTIWFGSNISASLFLMMIWIHNLSMFLMLCLTVGHVYFTFVYGALPHMITGYTTESYAKKHIKWLRALKENENNA